MEEEFSSLFKVAALVVVKKEPFLNEGLIFWSGFSSEVIYKVVCNNQQTIS
jgi:hypothetical protein